ncbi:hypothetical protein M153_6900011662 [Pseudoloma neurophilia]|uniref:Uncharacterized protein n=1 Tax=Pseudoloma neurophilia TaxID=146866 RepID=A0A0R0M0F4_9MICR|nr:hypothetical protein M153_6900011662 [Pseudoloma neurophilia]
MKDTMLASQSTVPFEECRTGNNFQNATCTIFCGRKEKALECECCWTSNGINKCSNETVSPEEIKKVTKDFAKTNFKEKIMIGTCPHNPGYYSEYKCSIKDSDDHINGNSVCFPLEVEKNYKDFKHNSFDSKLMFDFFNTEPSDRTGQTGTQNHTKPHEQILYGINGTKMWTNRSLEEYQKMIDEYRASSKMRVPISHVEGFTLIHEDEITYPKMLIGLSLLGVGIGLIYLAYRGLKNRAKKYREADDLIELIVSEELPTIEN